MACPNPEKAVSEMTGHDISAAIEAVLTAYDKNAAPGKPEDQQTTERKKRPLTYVKGRKDILRHEQTKPLEGIDC